MTPQPLLASIGRPSLPLQCTYKGSRTGPTCYRCTQVLDALAEVAFGAKFHLDRITKERSAVAAEAQMMNTIEYRVDCQLLRFLHDDNNLGSRFPIGKIEQVGLGRAAWQCRCSAAVVIDDNCLAFASATRRHDSAHGLARLMTDDS